MQDVAIILMVLFQERGIVKESLIFGKQLLGSA